ncbi:MAG TPA: hypothetical protein VN213_14480 [Solirubrobacteraceae bacterium]|nr:hypothetical protein [Solirubrobacteraceae bacterium]
MEILLVAALLVFAVAMVAAPLRRGRAAALDAAEDAERSALQAARDAKYREIREAELDYRTGKLAEPDWRAQDRVLRREAVEILRRLDEVEENSPTSALAERSTD